MRRVRRPEDRLGAGVVRRPAGDREHRVQARGVARAAGGALAGTRRVGRGVLAHRRPPPAPSTTTTGQPAAASAAQLAGQGVRQLQRPPGTTPASPHSPTSPDRERSTGPGTAWATGRDRVSAAVARQARTSRPSAPVSPPPIAASTAAPGRPSGRRRRGRARCPAATWAADDLGDQPLDRRVARRGPSRSSGARPVREDRGQVRTASRTSPGSYRRRPIGTVSPRRRRPSIQSRPKNTAERRRARRPGSPGSRPAEHRHGRSRASGPGRSHIERRVGTRVGREQHAQPQARHEAADVRPVVDDAERSRSRGSG